jgi:hypothetical protein
VARGPFVAGLAPYSAATGRRDSAAAIAATISAGAFATAAESTFATRRATTTLARRLGAALAASVGGELTVLREGAVFWFDGLSALAGDFAATLGGHGREATLGFAFFRLYHDFLETILKRRQ